MKRNGKRTGRAVFAAVLLLLLLPALLTGCAASAKLEAPAENSVAHSSGSVDFYGGYDNEMGSDIAEGSAEAPSEALPGTSGIYPSAGGRKIIEYLTLYVQTREFDSLIEGLQQQALAEGGYVESSSISGNGYDSYGSRNASFVVRIPKENSAGFADYVSQNGTVTRREANTDDVTLTYVDTESRLAAFREEKEVLEELMQQAEDLSSVIQIQERLTQVIYEIESIESQLRTYDNLIEYTTVTLYISEVERTAVVEEQSLWQEIGTNLSNNFEDMGRFFRQLFIAIASALPYWLLLLLLAALIVLIVKLCLHRRKKHPRFPAYPPQTAVPPASLPVQKAPEQEENR